MDDPSSGGRLEPTPAAFAVKWPVPSRALRSSGASPQYVLTGKFEPLRDFQLRVLEGDLGEIGSPGEPLLP